MLARFQLGKYCPICERPKAESSGCVGTAFCRLCELAQPVLRAAQRPRSHVGAALSSARPVSVSVELTKVAKCDIHWSCPGCG